MFFNNISGLFTLIVSILCNFLPLLVHVSVDTGIFSEKRKGVN